MPSGASYETPSVILLILLILEILLVKSWKSCSLNPGNPARAFNKVDKNPAQC